MAEAPLITFAPVDICNSALDQIGQSPIQALDDSDQSAAATACKHYFPLLLSSMLRDYRWNFAYSYTYLPQLDNQTIVNILGGFGSGGFGGGGFGGGVTTLTLPANPSLEDWPYWYALPNNSVKAWRINENWKEPFRIIRHALLARVTPVLLEYELYVDDPNVWDAMFRTTFETYLASRLAQRLLGNLKLGAELYKVYLFQLSEAKGADGQEGGPPEAFNGGTDLTTDIRE